MQAGAAGDGQQVPAGLRECHRSLSGAEQRAVAHVGVMHEGVADQSVSALAWAIAPTGDIDLDAPTRAAIRNRIGALAQNDPDDNVRRAAALQP